MGEPQSEKEMRTDAEVRERGGDGVLAAGFGNGRGGA